MNPTDNAPIDRKSGAALAIPFEALSWTDFALDGNTLRVRFANPTQQLFDCADDLFIRIWHTKPGASQKVATELPASQMQIRSAPGDRGTDLLTPWSVAALGVVVGLEMLPTAAEVAVRIEPELRLRMTHLWADDDAQLEAGFAHRDRRVRDAKTQRQLAMAMLGSAWLSPMSRATLSMVLVYKFMEMRAAGPVDADLAQAARWRQELLQLLPASHRSHSTLWLKLQTALWTLALWQGDRSVADSTLLSCSLQFGQIEDPMTGVEYVLRARLARSALALLGQDTSEVEGWALENAALFREVMEGATPLRLAPYVGLRKAFQCVSSSGRLLRALKPGVQAMPAIRASLNVALNVSGKVREQMLTRLGVADGARA